MTSARERTGGYHPPHSQRNLRPVSTLISVLLPSGNNIMIGDTSVGRVPDISQILVTVTIQAKLTSAPYASSHEAPIIGTLAMTTPAFLPSGCRFILPNLYFPDSYQGRLFSSSRHPDCNHFLVPIHISVEHVPIPSDPVCTIVSTA